MYSEKQTYSSEANTMARVRPAVIPLTVVLVVAGLSWIFAEHWLTASLQRELDQSLLLTSRAVQAEIDRFRALPDVAGEDARIRAALIDPRALDEANRYLETVAGHAGASELFLINSGGRTIAASNWNRPGSFVGQDYGFRPYFQQAITNGRGQYYAIGVTTGVPGFFLSTRVSAGPMQGVLVVKIDLRPLQDIWRNAGAEVALVDAAGVIFLSGRPDWIYHPLAPLPARTLAELETTRTYVGVALAEAQPLLPRAPLGPDLAGEGWIARMTEVPGTTWRLLASQSAAIVTAGAAGWAIGAAILAMFIVGLFTSWDQRRQIVALRLAQSEGLEAMVAARTADLGREIEARRQAEADLRATQEHLIHAEKMAALGRMSTAIVHEISQPLAAMEATLTAAELSLPSADSVTGPRLAVAKGLIRRMQRTTKHLKSFGRKETGSLALIDLRPVVASALELVTPRSRAVGITPVLIEPAKPVTVFAGAVRMEQVVVNLLLNALDAVAERQGAEVRLCLEENNNQACLTVSDTGHGISAEVLARVTEPFFSTKSNGEGLGLGLAISKAILTEFGGDLTVSSEDGVGTEARITLPLAKKETC
jgi:two-component system, NtrC family, C4-dicarboxylate transport sensor histidine kinase DctB